MDRRWCETDPMVAQEGHFKGTVNRIGVSDKRPPLDNGPGLPQHAGSNELRAISAEEPADPAPVVEFERDWRARQPLGAHNLSLADSAPLIEDLTNRNVLRHDGDAAVGDRQSQLAGRSGRRHSAHQRRGKSESKLVHGQDPEGFIPVYASLDESACPAVGEWLNR